MFLDRYLYGYEGTSKPPPRIEIEIFQTDGISDLFLYICIADSHCVIQLHTAHARTVIVVPHTGGMNGNLSG